MMKWDGASGGGNITHGLSQSPEFVIYKNVAATNNWDIYHDHIGGPQKNLLMIYVMDLSSLLIHQEVIL